MSFKRALILVSLLLITASCGSVDARVITPTALAPTHALLPYPDALDVVLVQDKVTVLVNEPRAENGKPTLGWDDALQDLAEGRAGAIVKGASYDEIDESLTAQLGEPVAKLRACMEDSITTPDAVAQVTVEHWMVRAGLREALLDRWQRIGVGLDWGCSDPESRGMVLVVLLAGRLELREG